MECSPGLFSSILLALLLLFMVKKLFGKSGNLPPGPRPLPILGNLLQLKSREIHKPILELSKKYGPVYTLYMGPKPAVVLCGFQAVKEALVDNGDKFSGRAEFPIVDLTSKGYGIAFSNGERWKELRRFSLSTLRDFGVGRRSHEEWIQEEIQHLLDIFQETNGSLFSPAFFIRRSISNVICSVIFGRRFEYTDPKLQTLLDLVAENLRRVDNIWVQLYNFIPSILYYFPGPHHKLTENYQAQLDYAEAIVREHEATLDPSSPRDYVDAFLIKMQQESKNPHSEFNLPNLLSSALDIFFAGQESTSSTLGYGLLILLKHPHIKKKVQAEIENVVGRARRPCMEDRVKMPYTEAVIHEFMRFIDFFPLGVPHAVTENTIFRGYTLPKGMVIFPVLHSVLYDPTVFKRPQEFYPEHFLDQNGSFKKCEGFMAFSAGKRSCPGEGLARTELFLYLTSILQKFDIRSDIPPEDIDLSPEYSGFGKMAPTFQMRFIPIQDTTEMS
ncbi:cytochrome P450 2G1-like isoform X1 [Dendrobates tinctorius]|uniref:cytochrome P450 2G1-like isoform X1 n=1 Tax=Dendrobates tinctorius TaxID=92724 RepID=UPI003CC9AF06